MEQLGYASLKARGFDGFLLRNAPERVLQFGGGNFLRAFAEHWIDLLNEKAGFGGKVVVLGDMGELGPRSRELHREVLAYAYAKGLKVVTVGRQFALAELDLISAGEVLLKGSHAMDLSSLIDERKQTK